ncbi:hypothetical protein ACHAWF_008333 [Thalassiosira exigua]
MVRRPRRQPTKDDPPPPSTRGNFVRAAVVAGTVASLPAAGAFRSGTAHPAAAAARRRPPLLAGDRPRPPSDRFHRLDPADGGERSSDDDDGDRSALDRARRRRRRRTLDHWGFERLSPPPPPFPDACEDVACRVADAVVGTIRGWQRPDPNVASNAMHRSVLDYRPTHPREASRRRWADGDGGDDRAHATKRTKRKEAGGPVRIGIEIDGAAYLSDSPRDEGRAMRMLSLHVAKQLASPRNDGDHDEHSATSTSVAVFFNSIEQSLLASRELSRWKADEASVDGALDGISIHCLGHDSLPLHMIRERRPGRRRQANADSDALEKIILVAKPTDYGPGSHIHSHADHNARLRPTIRADVVDHLQSLLFQASASSVPAAVLTPRLSELPPLQRSAWGAPYPRTGPFGFEQSGYQRSSTYGGTEPPTGPTSWLLRGETPGDISSDASLLPKLIIRPSAMHQDLVPPAYVWVGCAASIQNRSPQQSAASGAGYSRVALSQTAMEAGHAWHMFAVREGTQAIPPLSHGVASEPTGRAASYHYVGSSMSARGRPSSGVMSDALEDFCENAVL